MSTYIFFHNRNWKIFSSIKIPFNGKLFIHFERFTKGIEQITKTMVGILDAWQNETNVLDLDMRPKGSISKLAVAKLVDKAFLDLYPFETDDINDLFRKLGIGNFGAFQLF